MLPLPPEPAEAAEPAAAPERPEGPEPAEALEPPEAPAPPEVPAPPESPEPHALKSTAEPMAQARAVETNKRLFVEPSLSIMALASVARS
jgi:hypothetical protein